MPLPAEPLTMSFRIPSDDSAFLGLHAELFQNALPFSLILFAAYTSSRPPATSRSRWVSASLLLSGLVAQICVLRSLSFSDWGLGPIAVFFLVGSGLRQTFGTVHPAREGSPLGLTQVSHE